jgi:hypothetical protein
MWVTTNNGATPGIMSIDTLINAGWAGSHSPMRDASIRLWRMEQEQSLVGITFVVDVLSLWLRAEGPVLGIKTAGKDCAALIVLPVVKWWLTDKHSKELDEVIKGKHIKPARVLASKLDQMAWEVVKDIESAKQLNSQQ